MKMNNRVLRIGGIFLSCIATFSIAAAQENLSTIIKEIEPSVAVIYTYDKNGKTIGQGSGFFINEKGDVITNIHVLQGANRAEIKTTNGKVYLITKILAEDREGDLIQVSVNIPQNVAHPLSVSKAIPDVGERIVVIGSPLGLEKTVSDGIVSAVRDIPAFGKIIQITAPVSPGSSGSPVVNMKGEIIGVTSFQMVEGQNLNFAIPSDRIINLKSDKEKPLAKWEEDRTKQISPTAEELYSIGLSFLWAEDYKKALSYFGKAVKEDSHYAEAYLSLGVSYYSLGRDTEAMEACKQAIRIKPDYAKAHYNLGLVYHSLRRDSEAIEAFKQAIRIKIDFADAHCSLGVSYYCLDRDTEAIEAYKQAIRIKPDFARDAYFHLGVSYDRLRRYSEAIEAWKQAIRIKPDDAMVHRDLGVAYLVLGDKGSALAEYKIIDDLNMEAKKQAIRIKPDYAEAHRNLGIAYYNLFRRSEAIEAFKQAIRIRPDFAEVYSNLGMVYESLKRYSEAMEAYKQEIRIKPDDADAHYNLGAVYLVLGDKGSALAEYKILNDLNKDEANDLFNLIYK